MRQDPAGKVIIAIIMANKIEGSEIFDVPAQPKGWQAHSSELGTAKDMQKQVEHLYLDGFLRRDWQGVNRIGLICLYCTTLVSRPKGDTFA